MSFAQQKEINLNLFSTWICCILILANLHQTTFLLEVEILTKDISV